VNLSGETACASSCNKNARLLELDWKAYLYRRSLYVITWITFLPSTVYDDNSCQISAFFKNVSSVVVNFFVISVVADKQTTPGIDFEGSKRTETSPCTSMISS